MNKVEEFIENGWVKCLKDNTKDDGTLIGLPYPYTVPAVGMFDEIYYWDTYFTNVGLIMSGHLDYAKNNVDDMLYLVEKYGFVPNGNRTYYLNRSQPPVLSEMVKDVYEAAADDEWLEGAYKTLKKEYSFWMSERISPIGLNVYGGKSNPEDAINFIERTGYDPKITPEKLAQHHLLVCESGWDVNFRWGVEGYNYAPIDLNSLMYGFELNMNKFADILGFSQDASEWKEKARNRKDTMMKHMISDGGIPLDYNFSDDKLSPVFSVASYYTMFVGMLDKEYAGILVQNLGRLEEEWGISTCEKSDYPGTYQWGYPNGWPCIQYIIVKGLEKYGYIEDAKRIAKKYVSLVDKVFDTTGNLWEKYNVVEGNIDVADEYKMPPMLGWTAGVYISLKHFLEKA